MVVLDEVVALVAVEVAALLVIDTVEAYVGAAVASVMIPEVSSRPEAAMVELAGRAAMVSSVAVAFAVALAVIVALL